MKNKILIFAGKELLTISGVAFFVIAAEWIVRYDIIGLSYLSPLNLCYELMLVIFLWLPVRILLGRCASLSLIAWLCIIWGLAHRTKIACLGEPVFPDDFISFSHVFNSILFVQNTWKFYAAAGISIFAIALLIFLFILHIRRNKWDWKLRVPCFLITAILAAILFSRPLGETLLPPRIFTMAFSTRDQFLKDGSLIQFLQLCQSGIRRPDDESAAMLKKELPLIQEAEDKSARSMQPITPDIVFILNESAFDISGLEGIAFPGGSPLPVLQYPERLKKDPGVSAYAGYLRTPVFGGHTVCAEYEVLSGVSYSLLSPRIPYTYFENRQAESLAFWLKDKGYHTVMVHPFKGVFYSRQYVYPNLGMDEFLDIDFFPGPRNALSTRSDKSFYRRIRDLLKRDDSPKFLFCVSVQNHSPYDVPRFTETANVPFITEYNLSQESINRLNTYTRGLSLTDQALMEFFHALAKEAKRPTLVVLYGDHRPYLGDDMMTYRELTPGKNPEQDPNRFRTEYFVWSNFPLPHPEQFKPQLTMTELGHRALYAAGVKPYDVWLYLFDRMKIPETGFSPAMFESDEKQDPYFRMYHAYIYEHFATLQKPVLEK